MGECSPSQQQFDALPEWAQKMVRALSHCALYGGADMRDILAGMTSREKYDGFQLAIERNAMKEWWDGFFEAKDLADAITAPWPPPPAPVREKRAFNIVELMADGDDEGGFDQPCAFGNRVAGHAVYCHNDAWPNSPRKCRRRREASPWGDPAFPHEECPGFVANPDYVAHAPPTEGEE